MLLESEMPLEVGEGKNSPVNAIGILNRSARSGWACFSQRHSGNFQGEGVGVGVDVIGLWAGRKREREELLARTAPRFVVVTGRKVE
jgi:hypothetical protein